jgi:CRP-like cAMP-binding protein
MVSMPSSRTHILSHLSRLPLFNELEMTELVRISHQTQELFLSTGETIFHQGHYLTGFYCVISGRVKLAFTSSKGEEKVVQIVGPGGSFGEALMFLGKQAPVSSHALEETTLLHVAKPAVLDELERSPQFARKMLAGLSRRLHGLISDIEAYSLKSGAQRVIGYLLREDPAHGDKVQLHVSKVVLASRLNMTAEHFSRILHELTKQSLIQVEGRSIRIIDLERLRRYDK